MPRPGKQVMRPLLVIAVLAAVVAAGCSASNGDTKVTTPTVQETPEHAPWWNVGETWTIRFTRGGEPTRTTTLVNFANNTFNDPPHFWLGVSNRQEALDHVFFESNMFLGRIHWLYLAPHEKGRHSDMYSWPLTDGKEFAAHAFDRDWRVTAARNADGTFDIAGASPDGSHVEYTYDPDIRWFGHLEVTDHNDALVVEADVVEHDASGARGTYYFLRGRDYIDSRGGSSGQEEAFEVADEGATSIAFLMDDVRTGLAAAFEFVAPDGDVYHRETLAPGSTINDKVVEVPRPPTPGTWKIRYVGNVEGTILVRGIIEYKATI